MPKNKLKNPLRLKIRITHNGSRSNLTIMCDDGIGLYEIPRADGVELAALLASFSGDATAFADFLKSRLQAALERCESSDAPQKAHLH